VVAGLLAGCQSEATPPTTTSPSASATSATPSASPSSATPSPSPSVDIPAAARVKSDKGAEAFVRYFIEQAASAWTVPDPNLIERHATKDCSACRDLTKVAAGLKEDGQRYDKPPISVRQLKVLRSGASEVAFDAELTENDVNVVASSGEVVDSYPRRDITRAIAVKWGDGRWRLDGIGE